MKDIFDLKGRVALITGCSGGLGVQMANALAARGADLVIITSSNTPRPSSRWSVTVMKANWTPPWSSSLPTLRLTSPVWHCL